MHSLLDAGVVDEVRMLVCPASRGKGTRIFEDRQDLKLVEGTSFENGVALLRYEIQNWAKVRRVHETAGSSTLSTPASSATGTFGRRRSPECQSRSAPTRASGSHQRRRARVGVLRIGVRLAGATERASP